MADTNDVKNAAKDAAEGGEKTLEQRAEKMVAEGGPVQPETDPETNEEEASK